jgi:putative ABC transport system substrate-binding protein
MTCRLIGLLVTLALGLLVAAAEAPPRGKVFRIGWLSAFPPDAVGPHGHSRAAFRQGLREHGWIEGQNLVIEWRYGEGTLKQLPPLAAELVRLGVDVLVTGGGEPAIRALKQATSTIPIVMAVSADPVATGLVASLARPGGNITGLTLQAPELNGKRLELLREALPRVAHVAVLWNPTSLAATQYLSEAEAAAQALHLQLQPLEVPGPETIEAAFAAATKGQADALITLPDAMLWNQRTQIADLAAQHRLPALFPEREFVDAGGLLSYGPSVPANFHRAATYVDKILKGAKPADLPVEQPSRFELVINLKIAKTLGLTIPPTLLFQADVVIQ